jgi:hypothetical protein
MFVTKHIQMNELVEIEKEKEQLQRQLKILQDQEQTTGEVNREVE